MMDQNKYNKRFLKCFLAGMVIVIFICLINISGLLAQRSPYNNADWSSQFYFSSPFLPFGAIYNYGGSFINSFYPPYGYVLVSCDNTFRTCGYYLDPSALNTTLTCSNCRNTDLSCGMGGCKTTAYCEITRATCVIGCSATISTCLDRCVSLSWLPTSETCSGNCYNKSQIFSSQEYGTTLNTCKYPCPNTQVTCLIGCKYLRAVSDPTSPPAF